MKLSTESQKTLSNEGAAPPPAQAATRTPQGAIKPLPEDALALIPLRNVVLFPGVIAPITIGRESSVAAAQEAVGVEQQHAQ